ncbi:hypothetical protein KQY30_24885 [Streptomyces sp. GMY02]|uniref:hypothetical protein n=1 Tax=Streptomyces sp. GMY02 TaxID=1333528 RepID=UPI001C2BC966|nr:hypothetical protein [Streptomyces sp. GMY02]QXE36963.1 hypothetical protein KQY30_24885 [Streptomyces sp. GMY02]
MTQDEDDFPPDCGAATPEEECGECRVCKEAADQTIESQVGYGEIPDTVVREAQRLMREDAEAREARRGLRKTSTGVFWVGISILFAASVMYAFEWTASFQVDPSDPSSPSQPEPPDLVAIITAVTGLVTAIGGACGGVAALILARRTTLRNGATGEDAPATPPAE